MKIILADHQPMFREAMARVCRDELGHEVVAEAADGEQAVVAVLSHQPDLLLLDLELPLNDGFSVAALVRQLRGHIRIIALTAQAGSYTYYRIERGGFDGFVDKGAGTFAMLREAIVAVEKGQRYHSPAFLAARDARRADPASFDKILSQRELEVLTLIGQSLSNEEIALRLGMAPKTAETFRHRILRKLAVPSTPKLIRFAIEHGFAHIQPVPASGNSAQPFKLADTVRPGVLPVMG